MTGLNIDSTSRGGGVPEKRAREKAGAAREREGRES